MTTHFMRSYAELLIKTCHRRNIHAMGGMAAQIPIKNDEKANADAFAKVKADKEREATYGHDGTWVAHPGLVPVAKEAFDRLMPAPNQIASKKRDDVKTTAADLIKFEPETPITEAGLRLNINVAIQYIGAWLAGQGAVPIFNLMEDAATAEISRSQVWQWMRSPKGKLADGRKITREMVAAMIPEELQKIRTQLGAAYGEGRYDKAAEIFANLVNNDTFIEFLTLPAYELIDLRVVVRARITAPGTAPEGRGARAERFAYAKTIVRIHTINLTYTRCAPMIAAVMERNLDWRCT